MSDPDPQGPPPIESLPREDLIRLVKRANFVKEQQANRIGAVMTENLELFGIIQELQVEIQQLRPSADGDVPVPHPEVVTDVTS